jgi:chromosome partitioning protein
VEFNVTPGLGWPRSITADPRIGWPHVSRETLDWPAKASAAESSGRPGGVSQIPESPASWGRASVAHPTRADDDSTSTVSSPSPESQEGGIDVTADAWPAHTDPTVKSALGVDSGSSSTSSTGGAGIALLERTSEQPFRPPGPRRALFESDEFAPQPVVSEAADPTVAPRSVSRETSPRRLPRPPRTRTFVVANQKGGVGKTTTAVNVAAALAMGGLSVLVVDLDPQGNASTALGVDHAPGTPGTYEVLISGRAITELVVESPEAPGLMVLPATIDLAGAEIELVSVVARENRLLRALSAYLDEHEVDYVLLDCPPSLGLLTLNALVAATEILIPIQCEYYALEGVSQLIRTINLVKGELNSGLQVSTVLLTMFDARTRLAAQVAEEVRAHFAAETLPTMIPRSVRISEAPSYGQTVLTYHPDSAGAVSYLEAAREIARRGTQEEVA